MKLSKSDLQGTGSVYRFTLWQVVKSKANIISAVILLLFALLSMPLLHLFGGSDTGSPTASTCVASEVQLYNATALPLQLPQLASQPFWQGSALTAAAAPTAPTSATAATVVITDRSTGGYGVEVLSSADTVLTTTDLQQIGDCIRTWVKQCQMAAAGVTESQLALLQSGVSVTWESSEDALMGDFWIQYVYGVVILLLCTLSSTYIVRAMVEEKSTKLVELLTVSVSPLSLVLGKVLAIMTYVFGLVLALVASMLLSGGISSLIWEGASLGDALAGLGISVSSLTLSPVTAVVFLVSVLLSYLLVSLIAAISGASCAQLEEVDAANTTAMLLVLGGYILSSVLIAFDAAGAVWFSVLCPGVSAFAAPIRYLLGDIGLPALLLSWGIQLLLTFLLLRLCARVYREMMLYSGKRLRWAEIFRMARQAKGKEAAK